MEKGHYGQYTGNARHSRKEEMIHDRELIYDAKKQLHNADKDYKKDSPAQRALVGDQDKLPGHLKKAISDAPAQLNADLAYDPINDRADSPMSMYGKKESPAAILPQLCIVSGQFCLSIGNPSHRFGLAEQLIETPLISPLVIF